MEGSGTDWKFSTQIASVGKTKYKITARNKDGKQGRTKEGEITTTEKRGVEIVTAEVSPKQGNLGQVFTFNATTKVAAQSVTAVIGEKRYKMTGSGTKWSLKRKIDDLGTVDFYMVATNKEGEEGSSKGGALVTKALIANVISAKATSDKGYAGEEFTFSADTDQPASSVSLNLAGVTYKMEGSGKKWLLKRKIPDVGKRWNF